MRASKQMLREAQEQEEERFHQQMIQARGETRARPYYKQSLKMFSPTQTGLLPQPSELHQEVDTTKANSRRPFADTALSSMPNKHQPSQPRSKSSFGVGSSNFSTTGCNQVLDRASFFCPQQPQQQNIESASQTHQSALSKFAADTRSSRSQLRDQRNYRNLARHAGGEAAAPESRPDTFFDQQLRNGKRTGITSLLQQSRSSSNVIMHQPTTTRSQNSKSSYISASRQFEARSADGGDGNQQRQSQSSLRKKSREHQIAALEQKNSRQRSSKQRDQHQHRQYPLPQRTLKDCKNELKQDRLNKAKKRRHSIKDEKGMKKSKSRSKKLPEVVVVYRYPQIQSSHRTTTSVEQNSTQTPDSCTEQSSSIQMNALHQQLHREYSEDKIRPQIKGAEPGLPMQPYIYTENASSNGQQHIYLDSSVPISPSELQFAQRSNHGEVQRERRKRSDESLVESAEQIIKNYLRQEKKKNKKQNSTQSSHKVKRKRKSQSKSRQSTKNLTRDTLESTGGHGIKPYMREESSSVLLAPPPPAQRNPLTPSELADSYLVESKQQQKHFSKRQNGPFLYYQQQQKERAKQVTKAVMSSRPQEVVVSEVDEKFSKPSFRNSSENNYVSIDSRGFSNTSSSKLNLVAEYQNIMSQQELAYKSKMEELENIKNQVQRTAAHISRVHETRKSLEAKKRSISSKRSRSQQRNKRASSVENNAVREEERSTEKRNSHIPRSKLGQRYINYLQRNRRAEEAKQQLTLQRSRTRSNEQKEQSHQVKQAMNPSPENEAVESVLQTSSKMANQTQMRQPYRQPIQQPQIHQRERSPPFQKPKSPYRHKSVDNVKQYAISKIIGRLNTKQAIQHVYKRNYIKEDQLAWQKVQEAHARYAEAANRLKNDPSVHSQTQLSLHQDDSKSSFIHRFQKFHRRETAQSKYQPLEELDGANDSQLDQNQQKFSDQRSHSHIDLHKNVARYQQSRRELIPEKYRYEPPQDHIQSNESNSKPQYYREQQAAGERRDSLERQDHQLNSSGATHYTLGNGQMRHNSREERQQDTEQAFQHKCQMRIHSREERQQEIRELPDRNQNLRHHSREDHFQQTEEMYRRDQQLRYRSKEARHQDIGEDARRNHQEENQRMEEWRHGIEEVPKLNSNVHEVLNNHSYQPVNTVHSSNVNPLNEASPTPRQQRQSSALRNNRLVNQQSSQQQIQTTQQTSVNVRQQHTQQESIIDRQNDFESKMLHANEMQALMSRADRVLQKSTEHLQQLGSIQYPGFTCSVESSTHEVGTRQLESHKQESIPPNGHQNASSVYQDHASDYRDTTYENEAQQQLPQNNYNASRHFSHRISELQRQTNEVQKLPEFYNERVMSLKKRAMEVHEAALSYTSENNSHNKPANSSVYSAYHGKNLNPAFGGSDDSYQRQHHQEDFTVRQSSAAEDNSNRPDQQRHVYFENQGMTSPPQQYGDLNRMPLQAVEDQTKLNMRKSFSDPCDNSMVKQLDVTSSYLRHEEQQNDQQQQQLNRHYAQEQHLQQQYHQQQQEQDEEATSNNYTVSNSRYQSLTQGSRENQQTSSNQQATYYPQSYQNNLSDQHLAQTENCINLQQLTNASTRNKDQNLDQMSLLGADSRPHHVQVLSQEITLNQKKGGVDIEDVDSKYLHIRQHDPQTEFEMTKRLKETDQQNLSHSTTYRGPPTAMTVTTERADDNPNINDEIKARNKERRRQKREKKLVKLKELHDKAQYSMTQIASGLTSQAASFLGSQRDDPQHQDQNPCILSPGGDTQSQETKSGVAVRSTVEKLANTRREIKRLIKIQNKHGKLLKQLQKSGVVKQSEEIQLQESHASNLSVSEMSEHQKQFQMAQSTGLLQQMQEIFKYLAQIQEKLDYEIEERKMRTGQILAGGAAQMKENSALPLQMQQQKDQQNQQSPQYPQMQHQSNHDQRIGDGKSYQDDLADFSINQATVQGGGKLHHTQQNSQHQLFFGGVQQQQHLNSCQQSTNNQHQLLNGVGSGAALIVTSNQKNNSGGMSQGTTSTLFWDTQQAYNNNGYAMFGGQYQQQSSLNGGNNIMQNNTIGSNSQQPAQNGIIEVGRLQTGITTQENAEVRTTQSDQESIQKKDNKGVFGGLMDNQQMPVSITQRTEPDELEFSQRPLQMPFMNNINNVGQQMDRQTLTSEKQQLYNMPAQNTFQNSAEASGGIFNQTTVNSMNLSGIRVEQLCEILSREISRVREESVQQAHEMRTQYELELQQLRNEFYHHNGSTSRHSHQVMGDMQSSNTARGDMNNKALVQQRQMELFGNHCNEQYVQQSDANTNGFGGYQQQLMNERAFQQQNMGQPMFVQHSNEGFQSGMMMSQDEEEVEEPQPMPHTVFAELEKVKAERDEYFEKLMRVRNRIVQGKSSSSRLQQLHASNGFQTQTERSDKSSSALMMSGSFHQRREASDFAEKSQSRPIDPQKVLHGHFIHTTEGTQELPNLQQYQTDFNVQQQELQSQKQDGRLCDFSDLAQHQQFNHQNTFNSLESNPSSINAALIAAAQPRSTSQCAVQHTTSTSQTVKQDGSLGHGQGHGPNKKNGNVGKIVHQFRTFEDCTSTTNHHDAGQQQQPRDSSVGSRTSKTRNANGELCRKPGLYVNVRHNRTSMLRQNKVANNLDNSSQGNKCHSCFMASSEIGKGGGGSHERGSFKSNCSSTSKTRKVTANNMQNQIAAMSSIGGGRSSSNECTMCKNRVGGGTSGTTTPFIYNKEAGSGLEMVTSEHSSTSNRKVLALQQKRARTPNNDQLTSSNKANNSIFGSQGPTPTMMEKHQESHALPSSKDIGGRQTLQSMIPRSPDLINRLAAEHQQMYINASAAQDNLNHSQLEQQQTGRSIHENSQHNQSRALTVIQHYLEKYDKL